MSKHALEAYTGVLWAELRDHGVHVCGAAPGSFRSAIVTSVVQRVVERNGDNEWLRKAQEEGPAAARASDG